MRTCVRGAVRAARNYNPMPRERSFGTRLGAVAFTLAVLLATCQALMAHEFKAGDIEIVHPWSRATPDGAKVAAGYVTLKNDGTEPDRLLSVTGAIADKTEIYQMSVDASGVMTMRKVTDGVEIPAGSTVELKPGSYHIMFMELKQPPRQGETYKGVLTFEKAGKVEVEFDVQAMGSNSDHDAHDGHGG